MFQSSSNLLLKNIQVDMTKCSNKESELKYFRIRIRIKNKNLCLFFINMLTTCTSTAVWYWIRIYRRVCIHFSINRSNKSEAWLNRRYGFNMELDLQSLFGLMCTGSPIRRERPTEERSWPLCQTVSFFVT